MPKKKKIKNTSGLLNFFKGNTSLLFGLLLILIFCVWRYHNLRILSFNTDSVSLSKVDTGIKPVYIKSYPIGIDVSIKETSIENGIWQVNSESANYLNSSANIGGSSNIIIYGHNKDNILGPIRHLKNGADIEITGSDGNIYHYVVTKTDIVKPDNLQYLAKTSDETLTIYTCTGLFDAMRFVVIAKRVTTDIKANNLNYKITSKNIGQNIKVEKISSGNTQKDNEIRVSSYITYYGYIDNDPPGTDIAYPKKDGYNTIHDQASGVGSYQDPISFATDPSFISAGTIVYVPYIKKYAVMEDFCETCSKNIKNGKKHIDIWVGGSKNSGQNLTQCEEKYTVDSEILIFNPKNNHEVSQRPLCNN